MATVTFLWHLHQPSYRTRDNVAHAPWAAIHAGGSYSTLLRSIVDNEARGQVVNVVPTLVEQLEAYRNGIVKDPVIDALSTPADQLDKDQRRLLVEWCPNTPSRQFEHYPRLGELVNRAQNLARRNQLDAAFGVSDLRDIQVLFVLAHAGAQASSDPVLAPLSERKRRFSPQDHSKLAAWIGEQPGVLLDLLAEMARTPTVEIATSPYAHPIIPLMIDTAVAIESCSPGPEPHIAPFSYPEDATRQIDFGLTFMRERGFDAVGCWPPEGSVSAAALDLYRKAGVKWLVTDEGILERSLEHTIRTPNGCDPGLYSSWQLNDAFPVLFFRDRWLSDRIGFTYGRWDDERAAARDMLEHLEGIARTLPEQASIVVALDGENPWPHYANGGAGFLEELFRGLNSCGAHLQPATFSELLPDVSPRRLDRLHPGSWINSVFATWIGHTEKTRAWDLLSRVRSHLDPLEGPVLESTLLAEGSDWFWWLGDDNPTHLAPLYDQIFRHHLRDACDAAGVEPPKDLGKPIKSLTRRVRVPVTEHWTPPSINGKVDSYFEWAISSWVDPDPTGPIRRLGFWGNPRSLFVVLEGSEPLEALLEDHRLSVRLIADDGSSIEVHLEDIAQQPTPPISREVGRVGEIAFPWDTGSAFRLQVLLDGRAIPEGATMVLIPDFVDELAPADPEIERGR